MSAISTLPKQRLEDAVCLADTGTWGEDAGPGGGAPVLRSSNIQDGHLVLEDVAWRDVPGKHRESKLLVDGDLIVTMSSGSPAHIGKCCVFTQPFDNQPYYFSNFTLRLRAHPDRADPRWLFHWLSSPGGRAVLDAMNSTTSGLRNLNRKLYLSQKIPLPPLPEQRRIAAILDKADTVRRKRQQTLDLADQFLRSAFLDMFGEPMSPKCRWERLRLGDVVEEYKGGDSLASADFCERGFPVLHKGAIKAGGRIALDEKKRTFVAEERATRERRRFVIGREYMAVTLRDLVPTGPTIGLLASLSRSEFPEYYLAQGAYGLLVNRTRVMHDYLVWLSNMPSYRASLARIWVGSTQIHIRMPVLLDVRIPIPPMHLQEAFALLVSGLSCVARRLETSEDSERDLRGALVQRAFRGELAQCGPL